MEGIPAAPCKSTATPTATTGFKTSDTAKNGFRIHTTAVLLTYNGIRGMLHWQSFITFLKAGQKEWGIKHRRAILEKNSHGKLHIHVMLQFIRKANCMSRRFAFDGILPNAGPNNAGGDLCGEGLSRKLLQQSIDRGFFYVWADKIGTVRDGNMQPCVAGNDFRCT